jgi:N-acetylneuraminic acid mutarotase
VLDTADIKAGWKRLADLPGAPRLNCGCGVANGKIYVLGGVYASTNRTDNVVDSWVYDPEADRWSRVRDTPDGANRRAVVFKDRYIILMGEYQYGKTWHPDGSQTDVYTPEKKKLSWKSFFGKTVLVYDTKSDLFGTADPLLDQTSWPCAAIQRNTIFVLESHFSNQLEVLIF